MRILSVMATIGLVLTLSGCTSGVSVNEDYDPGVDFSAFETYAWIPQPTLAIGDAKLAQRVNSLLDKRITNAVDAQLQAKGMHLDTESPDLLLAYHVGLEDKLNVTNWGYGYPRGYQTWGGSVDISSYTQGTLILDLIASGNKELVWRGTAQKALSNNGQTPEQATEMMNRIAEQLLANYPPS